MKILRAYGIPEAIVRLIDGIYTGTKAKVVTADGITEIFDILAGVLQGDTLALYLFIVVIDYIMTVTIDDDDTNSGSLLGLHGVEGLVPRRLQTLSLQMMLPLSLIPLKGLNYSWTG